MIQHDEMDITSWLQIEGRRLAGACTRGPGQQQVGLGTLRPARRNTSAPPCSLSEALERMEAEKQLRQD